MLGKFTGSSISAFPYVLASKKNQSIFLDKCIPKDFVLSDPDHLPSFKINSLYHHLLNRQKKGLSPFIILNSSPQHHQPEKSSEIKKKMEYLDVVSEDEDGCEMRKNEDEEDEDKMIEDQETDEEQEEQVMKELSDEGDEVGLGENSGGEDKKDEMDVEENDKVEKEGDKRGGEKDYFRQV